MEVSAPSMRTEPGMLQEGESLNHSDVIALEPLELLGIHSKVRFVKLSRLVMPNHVLMGEFVL